jgi:hypothetical protein
MSKRILVVEDQAGTKRRGGGRYDVFLECLFDCYCHAASALKCLHAGQILSTWHVAHELHRTLTAWTDDEPNYWSRVDSIHRW